jgi:hypothetical protein
MLFLMKKTKPAREISSPRKIKPEPDRESRLNYQSTGNTEGRE